MNKDISHLPEQKQNELLRVTEIICENCNCVEMVILFGSYARGDWKDGPHEQGRGKLTIHKKSDYDILVVTLSETTARDVSLWQDIKQKCERDGLSTYLRIIPRDIEFVNDKLREGQYFFTEINEQGKMLFDNGNYKLDSRKPLNPEQEKRFAQHYFEEVFGLGKDFYDTFKYDYKKAKYKKAAFELNQACEHAYKAILLIYGGECPQEHHLDILGDLAADYGVPLTSISWRLQSADTIETENTCGFNIANLPEGTDLGTALATGEIDALFFSTWLFLPLFIPINHYLDISLPRRRI